jgi:hypothetical protein
MPPNFIDSINDEQKTINKQELYWDVREINYPKESCIPNPLLHSFINSMNNMSHMLASAWLSINISQLRQHPKIGRMKHKGDKRGDLQPSEKSE